MNGIFSPLYKQGHGEGMGLHDVCIHEWKRNKGIVDGEALSTFEIIFENVHMCPPVFSGERVHAIHQNP